MWIIVTNKNNKVKRKIRLIFQDGKCLFAWPANLGLLCCEWGDGVDEFVTLTYWKS